MQQCSCWVPPMHNSCGVILQVTGLRAGRFYAARIVASASCSYALAEQQQHVQFAATSSEVLPFRTLPTPPGQMQAPALAQRARTALKVGHDRHVAAEFCRFCT